MPADCEWLKGEGKLELMAPWWPSVFFVLIIGCKFGGFGQEKIGFDWV